MLAQPSPAQLGTGSETPAMDSSWWGCQGRAAGLATGPHPVTAEVGVRLPLYEARRPKAMTCPLGEHSLGNSYTLTTSVQAPGPAMRGWLSTAT